MAANPVRELRVSNPKTFQLKKCDPDDRLGWHKEEAIVELQHVKVQLDELQQRLFAENKRSLLLVLQAPDAAGKDGTIRSVFSGLNPAGVRVTSFKVPAGREASQDYLWRVHAACPARGEIGVFNRSHYEDVLVVRVKNLVPESVWKKRYRHITEFERILADEATTIVKCFLNVSKQEQAQRLQERLDNPAKNWKFRSGDLDDRKLWSKYQRGVRRRHRQDVDSVRPLVCRSGRSQLGAKPGRGQDPVEDDARHEPEVPRPRARYREHADRLSQVVRRVNHAVVPRRWHTLSGSAALQLGVGDLDTVDLHDPGERQRRRLATVADGVPARGSHLLRRLDDLGVTIGEVGHGDRCRAADGDGGLDIACVQAC